MVYLVDTFKIYKTIKLRNFKQLMFVKNASFWIEVLKWCSLILILKMNTAYWSPWYTCCLIIMERGFKTFIYNWLKWHNMKCRNFNYKWNFRSDFVMLNCVYFLYFTWRCIFSIAQIQEKKRKIRKMYVIENMHLWFYLQCDDVCYNSIKPLNACTLIKFARILSIKNVLLVVNFTGIAIVFYWIEIN